MIERVKHLHKIKNLETNIQKSTKALESLRHKYEINKIKESVKNGSLLKNLKKGDYKGILAKSTEIPVSKTQENDKIDDRLERQKDRAWNRKWLRGRPNKIRKKCKNGNCPGGSTTIKVSPLVKGESLLRKKIKERNEKLGKLAKNKIIGDKLKQSHYFEDLRRRKLLTKMRNRVKTNTVLQEKITKKALIKLKKAIQRVLFMIAKKEKRLKASKTRERIPNKLKKILIAKPQNKKQ